MPRTLSLARESAMCLAHAINRPTLSSHTRQSHSESHHTRHAQRLDAYDLWLTLLSCAVYVVDT
jgi:hypothetical protein